MQDWKRFAQGVGMHPNDVEELFEWEQAPLPNEKRGLLQRFLSHVCERALTGKQEKTFEDLTWEMVSHFYEAATDKQVHRAIWQLKQVVEFASHLALQAPLILAQTPMKIPSGKYAETMRVERTQQWLCP